MTAHNLDLRLFEKNRLEALIEGIYAVAMTIIVLELKVPDSLRTDDVVAFHAHLHELVPKGIAWVVSFLVLAVFWIGNLKLLRFVRVVDGRAIWINLITLLFVGLLPFTSDLVGEYEEYFVSQLVYSANLAGLALVTIWQLAHLTHHPELCHQPIPAQVLRGARFRYWSLIAVSAVAAGVAAVEPPYGMYAFLIMIPLAAFSRTLENRAPAPTAP